MYMFFAGYYMCQVNTQPMISQVGYLEIVGKSTIHLYSNFKKILEMQMT